jgi:hypothetical protein
MDWIVHLLVPWIGGKLVQIRYPQLADRYIALLMLGAVLPDIGAVGYLLQWLGLNYGNILLPFHTLVGSTLVAALISLLFARRAQVFPLLVIGFATHYALDSLLVHAGGGMVLFFPFSWEFGFQLGLVPTNSWVPAIITVAAAALLFVSLRLKNREMQVKSNRHAV